jgi:hypothetical protein
MVMEEASDPDESKLLLRALRDFAEDCRVPELNSACPYYEIAADSLPTCAEQCMDILGKHGAPPPTEVIEFEGGISLRRTKAPRPRRSVSSAKPYDAGEVYLSESSRPMAEWSTTTVLRRLFELVQLPPHLAASAAQRMEEIDTLRQIFAGSVDLEFDDLLPAIRQHVFSGALASMVLDVPEELPEPDVLVWIRDGVARPEGRDLQAMTGMVKTGTPRALAWVAGATTDELLAWELGESPTEVDQGQPPNLRTLWTMSPEVEWLIARSSNTYLHDWSTEAMCLEWRYLHGTGEPPPAQDMRTRAIPEDELALAMAGRLDARSGPGDSAVAAAVVAGAIPRALELLEQGEYELAATLFEGVLTVSPDNGTAMNCRAFCLVPRFPEESLRLLEQAANCGFNDRRLILANQAMALAVLGRTESVLELADELTGMTQTDGASMFLWEPASVLSGNPEVTTFFDDPVKYGLAIRAAILG